MSRWLLLLALLAGPVHAATRETLTPEQQATVEKFRRINASLHPQTGTIRLPAANAELDLGSDYYFLPEADAKTVLVDAWGNPAEGVANVMGMVFPKSGHFWNGESWAAVITYAGDGFISSEQHGKKDFDEAEKAIRDSEESGNAARAKLGAPPIHFVGWAQPPTYDTAHHTMIWARDLHFGSDKVDTLNYDVRVLGRRGYLSLNMISSMPHFNEIRTSAIALRNVARFEPGARYEDFNSASDKKSALGLAGLVAAGAGVVLAQKLGLLGLALLFLKKALVLVVAMFGAGAAWVRRMFAKTRKSA